MASTPNPVQLRDRRVTRPWTIAFACYWLAMTTGTHWPNLTFGPEVPATDKTIHVLAFAGLTVLLRFTGWVKSLVLLGLIVGGWAALDEWSQSIPALGRTATWHDLVADGFGVLVGMAWLWAFGGAGVKGGVARGVQRMRLFVLQELFARPAAWGAAAGGVIAGSMPMVLLWRAFPVEEKRWPVLVAVLTAAGVTGILWVRQRGRLVKRMTVERPCVWCGAGETVRDAERDSIAKRDDDRDGRPTESAHAIPACRVCGGQQSRNIWKRAGERVKIAAGSEGGHASLKPLLWVAAAVVALASLAWVLPWVYEWLILNPQVMGSRSGGQGPSIVGGWLPRTARFVGTLPRELTNAIDFALLLLFAAVVVRLVRRIRARVLDQAIVCVKCGHDLRATPVDGDGRGVCGECGTGFVKAM